MTQDLYYYESGYFTPENYFSTTYDVAIDLRPYAIDYDDGTYVENTGSYSTLSITVTKVKIADASIASTTSVACDAELIIGGEIVEGTSSWMSASTVSAQGNVTATGSISLSSAFTSTAIISHIEGADLFAMSNAALAAEVSRIRDNNIEASSAFTISTSAQRIRYVSSEEDSAFTMDVANLRVRYEEAALDAAFSLTQESTRIQQGLSDLTSTTEQTVLNDRVRFADALLESIFSLDAEATRIPGGVVVEASGTWTNNFDLTATISHIEGADLSAFSNASVSASVDKFTGISASIETNSTVEVQVLKIQAGDANLESSCSLSALAQLSASLASDASATSTVEATVLRIQKSAVDLTGAFTPTLTVDVFKNSFAVLDSTASMDVIATKTASLASDLTASTAQTANAGQIQLVSANLTSQFIQRATGYKRYERPLQVIQNNSTTISSLQSKFGGSSLRFATNGTYINYYASDSLVPDFPTDGYTSTNLLIEFWIYISGQTNATFPRVIYYAQGSTYYWYFRLSNATNPAPSFTMLDTNNNAQTITGPNMTKGAWHHVAIQNSASHGLARIFVDGTSTDSIGYVQFKQPTSTQGTLSIGNAYVTGFTGYIDELRIKSGTSIQYPMTINNPNTLTVPTAPFVSDDDTQFLAHYDTNFADDTTYTANASAVISATASISANVRKFGAVQAQADLTAASQATASSVKQASAQAALSSNGFVVSVIGKIMPEFADLNASSSLACNGGKLLVTSAALASQATLSAQALDLDLASIALTSQFTLSALVREIPVDERPINTNEALLHFETDPLVDSMNSGPLLGYTASGGSTVSLTPNGKFGQGIITGTTGWIQSANINLDQGVDYAVECWYKYGGDVPNYGYGDTVVFEMLDGAITPITFTPYGSSTPITQNQPMNIVVYLQQAHTEASPGAPGRNWGMVDGQIYVNWSTTNITQPPTGHISSTVLTQNVWYHFLISRSNYSTYKFYINGVLNTTWTAGYQLGQDRDITHIYGGFDGANYGVIDEFRLRRDVAVTSNFTPATAAYTEVQPFIKQLVSDVTSSITVTANFTKVKLFSAAFNSAFTSSTTARRLRSPGAKNLTSTTALASNALKAAVLNSTISASASLTTPINRRRQGAAAIASTSTVVCNAIKLIVEQAALTSTFAVTTNNNRLRNNPTALVLNASASTQASKIARTGGAFEAFVSELAAVVKIGQGFIHFDSTASVTATATVTRTEIVHITSQATVTAESTTILFGLADIIATSEQTTNNDYLRRTESIISAQAELTANNVRTRNNSSQLQATTELTANNTRTRKASSALTSSSSLACANKVLRLASANLTATFTTPLVYPYVVVRTEAFLTCNGFQLTAGRVIHLDPFYQLQIEPETRFLEVHEERRLLSINPETRVNIIKGYPQL